MKQVMNGMMSHTRFENAQFPGIHGNTIDGNGKLWMKNTDLLGNFMNKLTRQQSDSQLLPAEKLTNVDDM